MSRGYADIPRIAHSPECSYRAESDGYDATGIRYRQCFGCNAFEHEPLVFRDIYLGHLSRWHDLEHTPYGHESALLDFPGAGGIYSLDWTFHREHPERLPILKVPVPVAFDPVEVVRKDDAKEHEGVSFHEVWTDPIARTLWLGHKPFMITSQHFRGYCVGHANDLRNRPERLLGEWVVFNFDGGFGMDAGFRRAIGAQLVPFLIHALDTEGLWPFFRFPQSTLLGWKYQPIRKAA